MLIGLSQSSVLGSAIAHQERSPIYNHKHQC